VTNDDVIIESYYELEAGAGVVAFNNRLTCSTCSGTASPSLIKVAAEDGYSRLRQGAVSV